MERQERARGSRLSDLLLLAWPDPLPASLEEAIPRARMPAVAAPSERLGVFWEAYPPEGAALVPVTIALSIRGREADPGALRWSETFPGGAAVVARGRDPIADLLPGE